MLFPLKKDVNGMFIKVKNVNSIYSLKKKTLTNEKKNRQNRILTSSS